MVRKRQREFDYVVLLYPPHGVPRVGRVPHVSKSIRRAAGAGNMSVFATPEEAEAALETFLVANPEYRNWKDGSLPPTLTPDSTQ